MNMRTQTAAGFTLIEVLLALFLIGLGVLAVAPMFVYATRGNATGADFGSVGAIAVERMELLREEAWHSLNTGGSLTANSTGFFDTSESGYLVRWQIADNASPSLTRVITVRAIALRQLSGPRREVTLTTLRGQ